jgi:hypothetical protein
MPAPRGLKPGSKSCLFNAGLEGLLQPVALLPAAVATGLALPEDGFPEMIFSCFIVSAFISGHRARGCVPSLRDSFLSASLSPHLRAGLMNTVAGATGAEPRCTRWRHWRGTPLHSLAPLVRTLSALRGQPRAAVPTWCVSCRDFLLSTFGTGGLRLRIGRRLLRLCRLS